MAAIGCKYGCVLIFDILAREVIRSFSIYHDFSQQNNDVDQFSIYRKINFAYAEDDFIYQQKINQ
jgi:hypothetical protein